MIWASCDQRRNVDCSHADSRYIRSPRPVCGVRNGTRLKAATEGRILTHDSPREGMNANTVCPEMLELSAQHARSLSFGPHYASSAPNPLTGIPLGLEATLLSQFPWTSSEVLVPVGE